MNRQEAEHAQTGRLAGLEIVDLYRPETAQVESPVYTIVIRTKDGYVRYISDYHEALAFELTIMPERRQREHATLGRARSRDPRPGRPVGQRQ